MPLPSHFGLPRSNETPVHAKQGPSAASGASTQNKPVRVALACNQCRKRKVRCDAHQPKCRNCRVRGELCETSDPRKPENSSAVRRRATKRWQSKVRQDVAQAIPPVHHSPATVGPVPVAPDVVSSINSVLTPTVPTADHLVGQASADVGRMSRSSAIPGSSVSTDVVSTRTNRSERLGEDHLSWQSRAYQESTAAQVEEATHGHSITELGGAQTPVTPDVGGNADGAAGRTKVGVHIGASSVHCLFNFVDLHLARLPKPVHIRGHLLLAILANLPVIDQGNFEAEIRTIRTIQAASPESWQERVTLAHVPALVSAYAIISLGTNETSEDLELSFDYLTASHSLHGHLTAIPYLTSVQSLFLLSLALRAAVKDCQAWNIIGHAVRMAQSFGLHKLHASTSAEGLTAGPEPETLPERVWWSCFALEKLMQLECGRPSILDRSYDSLYFYFLVDEVACHVLPYFKAWIALSSIMGRISNRLYSHRFQGGSAEMLGEVIRLDQELLGWEKSLPDSLKPCNTTTGYTGDDHRVISTFLSQQYYHAQLSVMRFAIIFPQKSIEIEVIKNKDKLPSHPRLLDGASICANAARSIVTRSLQLADMRLRSTLLAAPPTYLAAVVLTLGVLRQPKSRLVRSDVELLASATEFVEAWYLYRGFGLAVTQTWTQLRERMVSIFQRQDGSIRKPSMESSAEYGVETMSGQRQRPGVIGSNDHPLHSGDQVSRRSLQELEAIDATNPSADPFGNFEFNDLWNMTELDFGAYDEYSVSAK
ncbi:hypothetical protein N7519_009213 [Penicillium mononematosum]|uniref:uncharacterized protein n=1 Tax=Penicillium mononematosum TaxID=268346 RepID=UPI002546CA12|nr:uncharacterized protein N7519_009213 [Penicillium mononematosum]KAJ6178752.1 hypothetical protein N7519_009213 [Penicillium mononematosum]